MRKRLQNRMAESRFAFPVMAVYGLAIWLAEGTKNGIGWAELTLFALSTGMMIALNNSNSLIRIYSRMVSCSFIAMTTAATFLFHNLEASIVGTCFILFYLLLLRSYQDKHAPGIVFYAFSCIGIASLVFVQVLYFVPFLWVLMATNMMAISKKMFCASLLGILAPYWFAGGYWLWVGELDYFMQHFAKLAEFEPLFEYGSLSTSRIATIGTVALLAIIGTVHFLRTSYLDKIRTRMIYEMLITINSLTAIFIILQPHHIDKLLPIAIINTSCLIAHYVALTKTRITNIAFIAICIGMITLTVFNLISME